MPTYKLFYFEFRGRAELIRLMLHYAGVEFEDRRIPLSEWPKIKRATPYGQLPVLQVDGEKLCQSGVIVRYLARELDLGGSDNWEFAKADEVAETMHDVALQLPWSERDKAKKKEKLIFAVTKTIPPMLKTLETKLHGAHFLPTVSFADIAFANCADYLQSIDRDVLQPFPRLAALKENIFRNEVVARYVAARALISKRS